MHCWRYSRAAAQFLLYLTVSRGLLLCLFVAFLAIAKQSETRHCRMGFFVTSARLCRMGLFVTSAWLWQKCNKYVYLYIWSHPPPRSTFYRRHLPRPTCYRRDLLCKHKCFQRLSLRNGSQSIDLLLISDALGALAAFWHLELRNGSQGIDLIMKSNGLDAQVVFEAP